MLLNQAFRIKLTTFSINNMEKITAAITGVQGYVPDYVLSNEELAKIVDTNEL